jgi:hypothetical protein
VTRGARIEFPGNPWPKGHPITAAAWTAQLGSEGLRFHLHVESAEYSAEGDGDDLGERDDWTARIVWNNYHRCTLSSTEWGHPGFLVATPGAPIDLDRLEGVTFRVDPIDGDELPKGATIFDRAFGIYLLGHDAAADHDIQFEKRRGPLTYDLRWRARVALAYAGQRTLAYRLDATLPDLRLPGIRLSGELEAETAQSLLAEVVVGASRFELRERTFVMR